MSRTITILFTLILSLALGACGDHCPEEEVYADTPQMEFVCGSKGLTLTVNFALDANGGLKGFVGSAPLPSTVKKVAFFVDGWAVKDYPSASYASQVILRIPASAKGGNLFLRLNDGQQIWANLGDTGFKISGDAQVAKINGGHQIKLTCSGKRPHTDGGITPAPPAPTPRPEITFTCCATEATVEIIFETDPLGGLKGFVGNTPLPSAVKEVKFFLDGWSFDKVPSAKYADTVKLSLPLLAQGNLFLRLSNGKEAWANLGDTGWKISGDAKLVKISSGKQIKLTCSGK